MTATFVLCSFTLENTQKSQSGDWDEAEVLLPAGMHAFADGDNTYIPPESTDRTVKICPGSGVACKGSATVGTEVIVYDGTKGILRPDIVIID